MPKLKVLHTITRLVRGSGVDMATYLGIRDLRGEFEFHLVAGAQIEENRFEALEGVRFIHCPDLIRSINPLRDLKALVFLYRLMRREGYDVVYSHETKAGVLTRLAARLAGCRFIIYGLHGVTFNDPMGPLLRRLYILIERWTVGAAHLILSVSQSALDRYHDERIGAGVPSRVIHSGIDMSRFDLGRIASPEARAATRRRLNFTEEDLVLVNVGRFSHAKAQRFVIEAFARLKPRNPRLKLLLLGDGELKEECRRQALAAGVAESVVFYGYAEDVPELVAACDLQLFTSLREGLPRAVVESYLCGVPVVCFDVEGAGEIIEEGVTGHIVRPGDVAGLCARAQGLLDDADLRRGFGSLGRQRCEQRWDHRRMVQSLRQIYSSGPPGEIGRVRGFFDGYAGRFDSIYGHAGKRGPVGRLLDRVLRRSMFLRFREVLDQAANPEIRSVLDVGCGPGHYCAELLRQGKTVLGLDIAPSMLDLARRQTAFANGRATYVQRDYLEFEAQAQFDAACVIGFMDYVQDPAAVLRKLQRDVRLEIYLSFPGNSGFLAIQRRLRYWLRGCPLYLYSRADIDRILADSGLSDRYEVKDLGRDYFVKVRLPQETGSARSAF